MLGITVAREEAELEARREQLVLEDAENKRVQKEIEDTILDLLKNSEGNILDDEVRLTMVSCLFYSAGCPQFNSFSRYKQDAAQEVASMCLVSSCPLKLECALDNVLLPQVLISTLAQSKVTSNIIERKVKEASKTQEIIAKTRTGYIPIAFRASQLFFCIADLATVDPMYQVTPQNSS